MSAETARLGLEKPVETPQEPALLVPGRAGLGVTTLKEGSDGIAYVARLLQRALTELTGEPPETIALNPARPGVLSRGEKLRFATRLAQREFAGSADWWLFNHLGIARVQNLIPRSARKPYGIFLMGIEAWDPKLDDGRIRTLLDAETLIAISDHTARRVRESHPTLDQVTTCHLALLPDEELTDDVDTELIDGIGDDSVLIVGRMSANERYKGHDQLLECWPQVIARHPHAELVIAGSGDDLDRLKKKAGSVGIDSKVRFTGFLTAATLQALRERVAIFAMPSRNEGFGLVYLEAMRDGLPCIGSTVDAACEIVADGETGLLVDPDDRSQLAGTITRLLENPDERRRMGELGRERFDRKFRFSQFVDRLRPILIDSFTGLKNQP